MEGSVTFNKPSLVRDAAIHGLGIAFLPEDQLRDALADGRLVRVLEDWCPPFSGYHLYYPSRRDTSPALAAVVDALRWKGPLAIHLPSSLPDPPKPVWAIVRLRTSDSTLMSR